MNQAIEEADSRPILRWRRWLVIAIVAVGAYVFVLQSLCGLPSSGKKIRPKSFRRCTVFDRSFLYESSARPPQTELHITIDEADVRGIFADAESRWFRVWMAGSYLVVVELEDGGECLIDVHALGDFFRIRRNQKGWLPEPPYYHLSETGRTKLSAILDDALEKVFMPARIRSEMAASAT